MISQEYIESMHSAVVDLRSKVSNTWPTPDFNDCITFATIEIAEALDAELDEKNIYKRNHDIPEDGVMDELADSVMMLLSAISVEDIRSLFKHDTSIMSHHVDNDDRDLPALMMRISNLNYHVAKRSPGADSDNVIRMICFISQFALDNGVDIKNKLDERLQRILKKHGGE